ncbi:helix-turn-helix domain-containing protein [Nocardiopsis lucentensis]|uniref:helix-turn-helix domain-containing protein n=1 Tax=Nocardiopsis lucentensis TaxID=53441 RepID=UPI00036023B0|nr:helix-turn-helix transcriptional regulator [Nocardiopsis lucentensis]
MPRKATVRARGLGAELRELRRLAGLTLVNAGKRMGWSVATVSRIETGHRGVTSEEVAALMVIYDAPRDTRERLIDMAREVDKPGWWETDDAGFPKQLTALIGFEQQATRITSFSLSNIPGLLQTPAYTRALLSAARIPAARAETLVTTRVGRQSILTRENPPAFHAILDEAVLRRHVGGKSVMADQIDRLVQAAQKPHVTIQVIPFAQGEHTGLDGPFLLLEFAKARTIVHIENKRSGAFLDESEDTDVYLQDAAMLRDIALSPDESTRFLTEIAHEYKES